MQEAWVIKWRNLEESRISVCMGLDIRIKLVKHSISGKISSSFETLIKFRLLQEPCSSIHEDNHRIMKVGEGLWSSCPHTTSITH